MPAWCMIFRLTRTLKFARMPFLRKRDKMTEYKMSEKQYIEIQDYLNQLSNALCFISEEKRKIQAILRNVQIINTPQPIKTTPGKAKLATNRHLKNPKIKSDTVKEILGSYYKKTLVYYIRGNRFNKLKYNEFPISWNETDIRRAQDVAKGNLSFAAYIIIPTAYAPWATWVNNKNTFFNQNGTFAAANVIVQDNTNGQFKLLKENKWLGLGNFESIEKLSATAMSKFVHDATIFSKMQKVLQLQR